jgi:acyl-CoA thioester hydrolase
MITNIYKKRVRYAETDKMGFLYYGHYAKLYEIGRAEMMRSLGIDYKTLEDVHHIIMPVVKMESRYKHSAYYDDELDIHTLLADRPTKMIHFDHKIYNQSGLLLNEGYVKLFFVDRLVNQRVSCPPYLEDKILSYF